MSFVEFFLEPSQLFGVYLVKDLIIFPADGRERGEGTMDTLRDLGCFALASRMKRLVERLKAEASRVYRDRGIDFNDSWFLAAWVLSRQDGITASEMADRLGISRPAVSQMTAGLHRAGLITYRSDPADGRRRRISLTGKGRKTVGALEPLWQAVGAVTEEMIGSAGDDLLGGLSGLEDALDEKGLSERISERSGR
jgi:DNA-binding MarR family transcriptional regulator